MPKIAFENISSNWLFSDFISEFETSKLRNLANGAQLDIHEMKDLGLLYLPYAGIWAPIARLAKIGL